MKRVSLRYVAPIAIALSVPLAIYAATPFTGPSTQPTGGNVDGVIWNKVGGGTQSNAKINISGGINAGTTEDSTILNHIILQDGGALRVNKAGAATYTLENRGSGQQPLTFTINGDLKVMDLGLPPAQGNRGRIQATEFCFNPGNPADCKTAWPSGGGGTLTGVTAGTGITVSGGAPSPTISATDLYVNTTGDTMTGNLTMNNAYPNVFNPSGYGGYFWGLYGTSARGSGVNARGVYSYIGSDVTNGYAGYFDAQTALGTSYGLYVRGPSSGPAAYFTNAGQNVGVELANFSLGYGLSVSGNTRLGGINDTTTVSGTLSLIAPTTKLCLGLSGGLPDCRTSWPSSGTPGGANTQVQFNNGGTFAGSANLTWNNASNILSLNGYPYLKGGGSTGWNTHLPYTDGKNYIRGTTIIADGAATELVGIGTSAPNASYKMHINGNAYTDGANAGWYFKDRSTALNWALYSYADEARLWNSIYGDVFRIHNNGVLFAANDIVTNNNIYTTVGNIGAQVTSPAYPLDVAGTANLNSGIAVGPALRVNNAEAIWYNGTYFSWGYGGTANYFADNVGIGVAAPTYQLQLSANSAAKPTSNVWTVASDRRLKDIHGTYDKGLDEITKLDPITYTYKKGNIYNYPSDTMSIGAVAQEVQKVFPEAVSTDKNGYLELDTNAINWASINAFKELKAQNEALQAKNNDLEQRLERLEAAVGKLK